MSELAFNVNGEPFEVPATASGWRVRRLKAKGAPEVVYGRDGTPLVLPVDADLDDLRDESGTPGRYRLDPIDDTQKPIANAPAGYVFVHAPRSAEPTIATAVSASLSVPSDHIVIEAMRMNAEIAKSVVDRFPQMLEAAATLLRAADGAGLPARPGTVLTPDEAGDGDDDLAEPAPQGNDLMALATQLLPIIMSTLASKKAPPLEAILDWRKATPKTIQGPSTATVAVPAVLPPLDPKAMAHVIAIQAALTPPEAALARQVASDLSPAEMRTWFDELNALSVPDAVAKIRRLIRAGGTS